MEAQLDLLDWTPRPLARRHDPDTSHAAAASIEAALPELEFRVLRLLRYAGPRGRTLDELVADLRLDKVTISPRLRPLCDKGLAMPAGKRPGASGRMQTAWVAR